MKKYFIRLCELSWGVIGLLFIYLGLEKPLMVFSVYVKQSSEAGMLYLNKMLPEMKGEAIIFVIGLIILIPYFIKKRWKYSLGISSILTSMLPLYFSFMIFFINNNSSKINDVSKFQLDSGENVLELLHGKGGRLWETVDMWLGLTLLALGVALVLRQYTRNKSPL